MIPLYHSSLYAQPTILMSKQLAPWHKFLITFHFIWCLFLFYLSIYFHCIYFSFFYKQFAVNRTPAWYHGPFFLFFWMHSLSTGCHRLSTNFLVYGKSINFWSMVCMISLSAYLWLIIKREFLYSFLQSVHRMHKLLSLSHRLSKKLRMNMELFTTRTLLPSVMKWKRGWGSVIFLHRIV